VKVLFKIVEGYINPKDKHCGYLRLINSLFLTYPSPYIKSTNMPAKTSPTHPALRIHPDSPRPIKLNPFYNLLNIPHHEQMQQDSIPSENHDKPLEETISTSYIKMLLQLDNIPKIYNILASVFTWLLLAGYIVLPGTFTSIRNSHALADGAGKAGKLVVRTVQNVPLLAVAGISCVIGALGMGYLSWTWQHNYMWLLNRIIL